MIFYVKDCVNTFMTFQRGFHAVEVGMLYIAKCKHSYDEIRQFNGCAEFSLDNQIMISVVTTDATDNYRF